MYLTPFARQFVGEAPADPLWSRMQEQAGRRPTPESPGNVSMPGLRESEQLNDLYKLYGIAAHNCCNIEYRIAYLLLGPKWKQMDRLTPEKVAEVFEKLERLPLGALLKEYKQHFNFTDEQHSLAGHVLDKRNYLTHRFFGKYGKKMHDPYIQKEMISELQELIRIFQSVSRSLDPELSEVGRGTTVGG